MWLGLLVGWVASLPLHSLPPQKLAQPTFVQKSVSGEGARYLLGFLICCRVCFVLSIVFLLGVFANDRLVGLFGFVSVPAMNLNNQ
jgi:hypothetical protein